MDDAEYRAPVKQLLTLGSSDSDEKWRDYSQLGIGQEHVDELIRMATDVSLNSADSDSQEVRAPLHAWRALGRLRAKAAVEPLLKLLNDQPDNEDAAVEELPKVFGMIGPAAIPPLSACLSDESNRFNVRSAASDALLEIAKQSPETRDGCARILGEELEKHARNDPALNGFLIGNLVELKSRQHLPLMKAAFSAGHVEEFLITGSGSRFSLA